MTSITRVAAYAATGVLATTVHYVILWLLVGAGLTSTLATTVGATTGAFVHYFVSARHVFRQRVALRSLQGFLTMALVGMAMNATIVHLGRELLAFPLLPVQLSATATAFGVTYLCNVRWTFRRIGTPSAAGAARASDFGRVSADRVKQRAHVR